MPARACSIGVVLVLATLIADLPTSLCARLGADTTFSVQTSKHGRGGGCRLAGSRFQGGERVVTPRAHERISKRWLPRQYFWGDVAGVNYLTPVHNQHIPQYCGSCWAFATSSMMSDRIKIARSAAFPEVVLSAQVLVNCRGGGTCHGGDPYAALEYMATVGIPEEGCQNYEAVDGECAPLGTCEDCSPGVPPQDPLPGSCVAVSNFTAWQASEYGYVRGGDWTDAYGESLTVADKIKSELWVGGPVACGIMATDALDAYRGGIYSEPAFMPQHNHELMIVGWGEENGVEYWIGRNSWGTYWGEKGLFRIMMHKDNLGIEEGCSWARPIVPPAWLPNRGLQQPRPLPWQQAVAAAAEAAATTNPSDSHSGSGSSSAEASSIAVSAGHSAFQRAVVKVAQGAQALVAQLFHAGGDRIPGRIVANEHRAVEHASTAHTTDLAGSGVINVDAADGSQVGTAEVITGSQGAAAAAAAAAAAGTAGAAAAKKEDLGAPWLERRGSYVVDVRVQKGRYHSYANPCTKRGKAAAVRSADGQAAHVRRRTALELPESYDFRKFVNYATADRNQHQPKYCGSCWAQATATALSDRIAMARGGRWPEIVLSAQALVNCVTANETHGCHGGDPTAAYSWVLENGLVDETCASYEAQDAACTALTTCRSCNWNGCWLIPPTQYPKYHITEHGQVSGEAELMAEVAAHGPVACSLCASEELERYRSGIFVDTTNCTVQSHSIVIAGYGEENGHKYWLGRNSWGREWGERGWFRLSRGEGDLGVTTLCDWAQPAKLNF